MNEATTTIAIDKLTEQYNAFKILMPAFEEASYGHECRIIVAEDGTMNGVCHDRLVILPIAYANEFNPTQKAFEEEDWPYILLRLDAFKKAINRTEDEHLEAERSQARMQFKIKYAYKNGNVCEENYIMSDGYMQIKCHDIATITIIPSGDNKKKALAEPAQKKPSFMDIIRMFG